MIIQKGGIIMIGNILVAHGMRKGNQNEALEEFIGTLLKDEQYYYELAFLESETQNLEIIMEKMISKELQNFVLYLYSFLVQCIISVIFHKYLKR